MGKKRDKAYRIWKDAMKYISKLKENYYYWIIKDSSAPKGYRKAKNWKEIDNDNSEAKLYKKTMVRLSSKWGKYEDHIRIKKLREESRKMIDDELKEERK